MIKTITMSVLLLILSSLCVRTEPLTSTGTASYGVSIGFSVAFAATGDEDEDEDWQEEYEDWLDEWDGEMERFETVGERLKWYDEYDLEEWLEDLRAQQEDYERDEQPDEEPSEPKGVDAVEKCEIVASDNRRVCRNIANSLAATSGTLCLGFVNTGAIAVCEALSGLAWDDALSSCDTAYEVAKAKCD